MRTSRFHPVLLAAVYLAFMSACGSSHTSSSADPSAASSPEPSTEPFQLHSAAFVAGGALPLRHSCDGEAVSPPLEWTHAPEGTRSFVLICEDPDAVQVVGYVFIHWVVYNIAPTVEALDAGIPTGTELADGGMQGKSSLGSAGYVGACPPQGEHRYYFRLYALDTTLDLADGPTAAQVRAAMEGHVLAQAELMGTYSR